MVVAAEPSAIGAAGTNADRTGLADSPAASGPRGEIHNLQILRFLAAAMVLVSHAQHEVVSRSALFGGGFTPFEPVWWAGGVDIFFVISGFIMCFISRDRFGAPGASAAFLARRLIRLVPLYWAVTAAMLLAILFASGEVAHTAIDLPHVVASFFFLPWTNGYGAALPLFIGGWTLNYEMLFYAIFMIALLFRRPVGLLVVAAVLILLPILGAAGVHGQPWRFWCDPIVLIFLYGVAISVAYDRGIRIPVWAGAALVVVALALMVGVQAADLPERVYGLRYLWGGGPAFVLVAGAVLVRPARRIGVVRRLLVLGGDASYALYLTHPFFLGVLAILYRKLGVDSPAAYLAGALIVCIAGSVAIYLAVERPIYRRLGRLVTGRRSPRPA